MLVGSVIALFACASSIAEAQVSGRVVDKIGGNPIPDARLTVIGTNLIATTNDSGSFTLVDTLPQGCHRLSVRALGYGWTEVQFKDTTNGPIRLGDVPLGPIPVFEWPLLLITHCDAGPIPHDEAPWGVDTLSTTRVRHG